MQKTQGQIHKHIWQADVEALSIHSFDGTRHELRMLTVLHTVAASAHLGPRFAMRLSEVRHRKIIIKLRLLQP